jgi:N-carbamoyl-L-amino-acid hydrolase
MALAQLGATEKGGVCRLALTDLDRQARDLVVQWARAANLSVTVDKIGNVFMRRDGRNPALPPIVTGSHIDTQPTGGKFDGNYGVLAGLEVVRTLNDHQIDTDAPIELVFWTNEEGSRFVPVMMGSGVFCGAFTLEDAYRSKDRDGLSVEDELRTIGYLGAEPCGHPIGAYFETHIEQGPILEAEDVTIGVVTGVLGLRWYDCTVTGFEAHAGPTPMASRRDALQTATAIMRRVVKIAHDHPPEGRGTVGMVDVFPNSRNVIPGRVTFSIDLRHSDISQLDRMDGAMRAFIAEQKSASGLDVVLTEVSHFKPCLFDSACVRIVEDAAVDLGYSHRRIVSGAGHDAVYVARVAPSAMIFIPCKDGISHNEIEDAKPGDLTAGANVLLHAILASAGRRE